MIIIECILTNWNEKDPIVEFAKNLRKSSDKEDWQLAKKLNRNYVTSFQYWYVVKKSKALVYGNLVN